MFGFALVADFLVLMGVIAAVAYGVMLIRDARLGFLGVLGAFASFGISVLVLLAVVNLVIMTAGMFTRISVPFMPAYGSPVRTVIAAALMNGAMYAVLGAALFVWNRPRSTDATGAG